MKIQLAGLALMAITIVGCNSTKNTVDSTDSQSMDNTEINNTDWELITLEGQDMDQSTIQGEKTHFTLNSADNTISGYSGCNIFNGNYKLEDGGRISFSQIGSTRMACPDAETNENEVLKVFELADNYTVHCTDCSFGPRLRYSTYILFLVECHTKCDNANPDNKPLFYSKRKSDGCPDHCCRKWRESTDSSAKKIRFQIGQFGSIFLLYRTGTARC